MVSVNATREGKFTLRKMLSLMDLRSMFGF